MDSISERKTNELIAQGLEQRGAILSKPEAIDTQENGIAVVFLGAVYWVSPAELSALIRRKQGSPQDEAARFGREADKFNKMQVLEIEYDNACA